MLLTAVPAREINMDGELHVTGACCGDGAIMGYTCQSCRDTVHQQPIHGGIADSCETCDREDWDPFGTHPTDKDGFVDYKETFEAIRWRDGYGLVHLAWVGKWRVALGCALSPHPYPTPSDAEWPTCLDCVMNEMSTTRYRQP